MQRRFVPVVLAVGIFAAAGCSSATSDPSTSTSSTTVAAASLPASITLTAAQPLDVTTVRSVVAILQRRAGAVERDARVEVEGQRFVVRYANPSSRAVLRRIGMRAVLGNRLVLGTFPAKIPIGRPGQRRFTCAALVTAVVRPAQQAFLWDSRHRNCYDLGPVVLDGTSVLSAQAAYDPTQGGWLVQVMYRGNVFVDHVADPYVNKQVAIVLDDVVLAAPTINPGITGGAVQITADFTQVEARAVAAALGAGPLPVALTVRH